MKGQQYQDDFLAWESLNAKFIIRLSPLVLDITLNFGKMLATCNQTLQCAHIEGLLDFVTRAILYSCTQLETFSVHIETPRNYTEVAHNKEGFEVSTTEEQWKVIRQIMVLVTEVTSISMTLGRVTLSIQLNDSRKFPPHLQNGRQRDV